MTKWMMGAAAALLIAGPASAALPVGAPAPQFTAQASMGGKVFTFDLAAAEKKGPVVLYFYPAAFTPGCTLEAHAFADATAEFAKYNATVIGVTRGNIDRLNEFSVSECRSKFPVAADADGHITKAYDAALKMKPDLADRTSYVISRNGKVVSEFTDLMDPTKHVEKTMAAVKTLAGGK